MTGSPTTHMAWELLKRPRHQALARVLHAGLKSIDLELACLDKVIDVEASRCRSLNRYLSLSALGRTPRVGLSGRFALLGGAIALSHHDGHSDCGSPPGVDAIAAEV